MYLSYSKWQRDRGINGAHLTKPGILHTVAHLMSVSIQHCIKGIHYILLFEMLCFWPPSTGSPADADTEHRMHLTTTSTTLIGHEMHYSI